MTSQERLEKYNQKQAKILELKNKIANVESCEELLSDEIGFKG